MAYLVGAPMALDTPSANSYGEIPNKAEYMAELGTNTFYLICLGWPRLKKALHE